jgi:hypothetical protein
MIICSSSNIDIIQGEVAYGSTINANESIVDWRLENSNVGVLNILNSSSIIPRISVIENGNIGVGTVPAPMSAKLEIAGDINITGIYKKGNRDILADTSNYILATSNTLVSRINAGGGGSGGAITSGGNLTLTNNATSNTILSIANSNVVYGTSNYTSNYSSNYTSNVVTVIGTPFTATFADSNAPSGHQTVTGSNIERIIIFKTANVNHTFTVPAGGINCDILMIGGGGGASSRGGGGAGACIVAINQTLPAGSCVVNVGNGGSYQDNNYSGANGGDSFITVGGVDRYRAKGGGTSRPSSLGPLSGGCGAGPDENQYYGNQLGSIPVSTNVVVLTSGLTSNVGPCISSTFAVMGNAGGNNGTVANYTSGGGGGTSESRNHSRKAGASSGLQIQSHF